MADLKMVYAAPDEAAALEELESFGEKWNSKYPKIYKSWSERWATAMRITENCWILTKSREW